jgi:RHS repeat-associated protein
MDAAGNVIPKSTIGNNILFQGREYEPETNFYYFRARHLDPIMGRFLQTDPMGYQDSLNLYQAFNQNPVNFTDPFGLLTQEQRRKVGAQVFRLIMAPNDERKLGALEAIQAYRAEFGELTQEDIVDVFGENDYILAATNLDPQTILNYAGAKIALGIDDLSTSYDPSYSSRYGDMHSKKEIDPQRGLISLYNESVNSRSRIQRMTKGKKQGLYVDLEADADNYESVLSETMKKRSEASKFAFAITSFAGTLAARTNIMAANKAQKQKYYRYVGEGEAEVIRRTGKIPNVDKYGNPKDVYFTNRLYKTAGRAKIHNQLPNKPVYRIEIDPANVPNRTPFTKINPTDNPQWGIGGGVEASTKDSIIVDIYTLIILKGAIR